MSYRILVVDDNPAIHQDIRKILLRAEADDTLLQEAEMLLFGEPATSRERAAFTIDSAYQGQEGLELVTRALSAGQPYALAFIDVRMPPGWDGIETIGRIWETDPELQIVICTAYSDYSWEEITEKVCRSDSVLILKKPFDNVEVLQMAHALAKKWDLTQESKSQLERLDGMVAKRTAELRLANEHLTREIAERTQAEQQRQQLETQLRQAQKMEAIGHLAAGVAHDFRNILTVIQGHANLRLLSPGLDPDMIDSLTQINEAVERASNLTKQLLAFSRKQIMQCAVLQLNSVVENLTRMLVRLIGEQISLKCRLHPNLPLIEADACSLEQVVINLAVNARDAMPDGGQLTVSTGYLEVDRDDLESHPEGSEGRFVYLAVSDTGCGMDEKTKQRLFEPFFTTKEVGKGTGMGLATAYGVVKQHKGWIEVQSAPGQGATFTVFLPASAKPETTIEKKPLIAATTGGSETILVVEDEEPVRRFVTSLLEQYGYNVRVASNGVEALDVWKQFSSEIDLLLTDVIMPEKISGLELADRLLKEKSGLKVIYTSGYSIELMNNSRAGVNFLPKPYHPARLAEIVRKSLAS